MGVLLQRPELRATLALLGVGLPTLLFAWLFSAILVPVLLAAIVYIILDPVISLMERNGVPRSLAIGGVLLLLLGLMVWVGTAAAPFLGEQFSHFQATLPHTWGNLAVLVERLSVWLDGQLGIHLEADDLLGTIEHLLQVFSTQAANQSSAIAADLALWLFLVPMIAFFLLRDFRTLRKLLINAVPNRAFEDAVKIYHQVSSQLEQYVRGVALQSTVMACIVAIGLSFVGLPMAALLGIMAGILNLIPYLGPLLGLIPPVLVALSMGIDPNILLGTVATLVFAQLFDNAVVVPTILARAANLHPLIALLGIIVAGNLFGLVGMVLALPAISTTRIIYQGLLTGFRRAQSRLSDLPTVETELY